MKFYNLDLRQLAPHGIPLNLAPHTESTGYINDFFLQGFEHYFARLFTVDDDELQTDYSRSCASPNSLFACQFCTDAQIETFITEAGFRYYPSNDHAINARFMYDLSNLQFGTEGWLTAVLRYIANSFNVTAKLIYSGYPKYCYGVYVSGDITTSANTASILNRLVDNLKALGTAHTQLDECVIEDTSSKIEAHTAVRAVDAGIICEVEIPVPYDVYIASYGGDKLNLIKGLINYFSIPLSDAGRIATAVPTTLSAFNDIIDGGPYSSRGQATEIRDGLLSAIRAYAPNWNGIIEII